MADEPDFNKMAVEFIHKEGERIFGVALKGLKKGSDELRLRLARTYEEYLRRLLNRYGKAKSFFVRQEPLPLYHFFVPLDLATQLHHLHRPSLADLCAVSPRAIITGSGGCGKSMMMRHFVLSAIGQGCKTPLFIELRQFNNNDDKLVPALLQSLQDNGLDIDAEYFLKALKAGHFAILLDGYDEVELRIRKRITREVNQLAAKYPANWIVMSSRPDNDLEGWAEFARFSVEPLTLQDAVDLVNRLPYDDEPMKERFIADMRHSLFAQHKSFLSNPLLLSIMLLTYSDVAHIPEKVTLFYQQAYQALFQRHDALKSGYQRERRSALDIQDFARVFAAFSIVSYDRGEFAFTLERALELLETSKSIGDVGYNSEAVLQDAVQAVCLLLEDGMQLTFAHRSFQEYFAARFIHSAPEEVRERLVKRLSSGLSADNVMLLLHELDAHIVERYLLLPVLGPFIGALGIKRNVGMTQYVTYLKSVFDEIRLIDNVEGEPTISLTLSDHKVAAAITFVWMRYSESRLTKTTADYKATNAATLVAFTEAFGTSRVIKTRKLTPRMPFVKTISNSTGLLGVKFLQELVEVEADMRARHERTLSSVEAVLGARTRHQALRALRG